MTLAAFSVHRQVWSGYKGLVYFTRSVTSKQIRLASKNTRMFSQRGSHQEPGCFALSCPEFVFRLHGSLSSLLMKLRLNYHQESLWPIGAVWTVCSFVYKPKKKEKKVSLQPQASETGSPSQKVRGQSKCE